MSWVWTQERAQSLSKLWSEGYSASQCAHRLHAGYPEAGAAPSRSAVIGKVHRLGLSKRATTSRNKAVRRAKPARKVAAADARLHATADKAAADKAVAGHRLAPMTSPSIAKWEAPCVGNAVAWADWCPDTMCRYVIGEPVDQMRCGNKRVRGQSYCTAHGQFVARRTIDEQEAVSTAPAKKAAAA
ncbi:MAG: GcrA family cell cycle regulator [Pseudomonadota bacterium]